MDGDGREYGESDSPDSEGFVEYEVSDEEVLSIVRKELESTLSWTGSRLSASFEQGLDDYFGEPRGDERVGRSSIVTREVFEQVEWALPGLMEVFLSGNEVCKFEPVGPEDEGAAQQQTDAVNHTFRRERGDMLLYTAFKDALVSKNCIAKVTYEENYEATIEQFYGKSVEEYVQLEADPEFELLGVSARIEEKEVPPEALEQLEQIDPAMLASMEFDIEGRRTSGGGRVRLRNVIPEYFVINRDARGANDDSCRFIGERVETTRSQLVAMGIDRELVDLIPASGDFSHSVQGQARFSRGSQDEGGAFSDTNRNDSEAKVWIGDYYAKVDRDGDGISEWWHVLVGGEYGQLLLGIEPADGHPYACGTAIPIPHRFYGLSIPDVTRDLQGVNTGLRRNVLDAANLSNDPRNIVLFEGDDLETGTPMVDIDQLNNPVPGGWIAEFRQGALRPYEMRTNIAELTPLIELHEKSIQKRTGISPESQGIDPQSISKHVYGAMVQATAAQQRQTLYARVLAMTFVTDLFRLIAKTLAQNVSKEYYIRLRGEWTPVDPSGWSNEYDCTIAVGLGHGSRMERIANLTTIGEIQKQFVEGGLSHIVSDEELHNTASELTEALGFKDTVQFFKKPDPENNPMPPPEPTPEEKALELQQQIEMLRLEIERQKVENDRFEAVTKAKHMEWQHEEKLAELRLEGAKVMADDPNVNIAGAAQ